MRWWRRLEWIDRFAAVVIICFLLAIVVLVAAVCWNHDGRVPSR